ncbi:MAG: phage capsid protein [Actinobacteria bacterium]|nr:phage capsid protein [Actinomycetota bacterium]
MAVLTAQGISRVAIDLLVRRLALPRTATMLPAEEFAGSNGDTITVRVPQPGAALIQAGPGAALTPADVNEVPVDVTLAHVYHLKNVSDQELSMQLEDFARQVTRVQVNAVAIGVEDQMAAAMNGQALDGTIEFALAASADDTKAQILAARQALGEADVPPDGRFFAVSPDIATRVLSVPEFTKVNESGSAEALRRAVIGNLYGFTFVESNGLTAGTACAYHQSGVALGIRAPVRPRGATESASISEQGVALRHVFQYAAATAQDQSLVSTFAGAAIVAEDDPPTVFPRFIRIGTATS